MWSLAGKVFQIKEQSNKVSLVEKRLRITGCAVCPYGWTLKIIKWNQIFHAEHKQKTPPFQGGYWWRGTSRFSSCWEQFGNEIIEADISSSKYSLYNSHWKAIKYASRSKFTTEPTDKIHSFLVWKGPPVVAQGIFRELLLCSAVLFKCYYAW